MEKNGIVKNGVKIAQCCALCEYLWDKNNCPLYSTYNAAKEYGNIETFDNEVKYKLICDEFDLSSKWEIID